MKRDPSPREPSSRGLSAAEKYPGSVAAWARELREMGLWREALRHEYSSREPMPSVEHIPYPSEPVPVDPTRAAGFIRSLDDDDLRQGIQNHAGLDGENARVVLHLLYAERDQRAASQRKLVVAG